MVFGASGLGVKGKLSEYCVKMLEFRIGELKRRHLIMGRVHEVIHGLSLSVLLANYALELRIAAVRLPLRILQVPFLVLVRPILEPLPGHDNTGGQANSQKNFLGPKPAFLHSPETCHTKPLLLSSNHYSTKGACVKTIIAGMLKW